MLVCYPSVILLKRYAKLTMSTNAERFVRVLIRFMVPCVAVAMAGAGRVR